MWSSRPSCWHNFTARHEQTQSTNRPKPWRDKSGSRFFKTDKHCISHEWEAVGKVQVRLSQTPKVERLCLKTAQPAFIVRKIPYSSCDDLCLQHREGVKGSIHMRNLGSIRQSASSLNSLRHGFTSFRVYLSCLFLARNFPELFVYLWLYLKQQTGKRYHETNFSVIYFNKENVNNSYEDTYPHVLE